MTKFFVTAAVLSLGAIAGWATAASAADGPPMPWAWGANTAPPPGAGPPPPAPPPQNDNVKLLSVPGSKVQFTRAQVANRYAPADWFPEDHPQMPDIVAHGREGAQPTIYACGLCHYPNGKGRPENANVTGLSYEYIVQQLTDFKNGAAQDLRSAQDQHRPDGELRQVDDRRRDQGGGEVLRGDPVDAVDQGRRDRHGARRSTASTACSSRSKATAPAPSRSAARIIETPVNIEATEYLRNPRSGFYAYVPKGSVKKGEEIAHNGARQGHRLRRLPRPRSARHGPGADARRPLAELSRAPALRHAARQPRRRVDAADGPGRGEARPGRHPQRLRLPRIAAAVSDGDAISKVTEWPGIVPATLLLRAARSPRRADGCAVDPSQRATATRLQDSCIGNESEKQETPP